MPTTAEKSLQQEVDTQIPATFSDFDSFYRSYWRRIYSLCLSLTRDAMLAEDLTQDAFLVLLRKHSTFRGESALYTWFYRVAFNLVLMQRRKRRQPVTSLDELLEASSDTVMDESPLAHDDARLKNIPQKISLERAIATLAAGSKAVLVLHAVEGFTHEEIGRRLRLSVGTSKSRLLRARRELQVILRRMQSARSVTAGAGLHAFRHALPHQGCFPSTG